MTRDVDGASTLNQTYTYDGLHRLRSNNESGSTNDRYWKLDQLGNWESLYHNTSGTGTAAETRAHNDVNELTGFTTPTSTVDPVHDAAGNMTTMPEPGDLISPLSLKYDAWNRLVEIDSYSGNADMTAEYDGLNRRIVRISGGETRHFYYNQQWQVLEERVGTSTSANKQFVYHPHYVDAIAMRRDASGNDHYFLQDANFNVTAVVDNTGTVKERYAYTPYGEVTILDLNFSAVSGNVSTISNEHLYTGRRRDPETGLQLNRNRFYASGLGRWVNRDPIGYDGGYNLYEYVESRPLFWLDPSGECGGLCIGGGILIGIWLGSQAGCDVPPMPTPPPPATPPPLDDPCSTSSNPCCQVPGDSFNRPNPNWPPPGSEHIPIPGQGAANAVAGGAGCISCNQGKGNKRGRAACKSCCRATGGGSSKQVPCAMACDAATF